MQVPLTSGSYFGQATRQREGMGLILTESAYTLGTEIPSHFHENAFFYFVLEGVCRETSEGIQRTAPPSTLVFHPAGEWHSNRWEATSGRCFHIELGTDWIQRLQKYDTMLERPAEYQEGLTTWLATRLYNEFQRTDPASSLAVEGLTLELVAEIVRLPAMRDTTGPPRWLEQVRDLLQEQFAERLSVEEIAGTVQVHPAHLVRAFRRYYHCTLGDYLRQLRIDFVCRQLSTTDIALADLAVTAGFSDQSHLCKTFKRIVGLTPTQFQQNFRQCKSGTNR